VESVENRRPFERPRLHNKANDWPISFVTLYLSYAEPMMTRLTGHVLCDLLNWNPGPFIGVAATRYGDYRAFTVHIAPDFPLSAEVAANGQLKNSSQPLKRLLVQNTPPLLYNKFYMSEEARLRLLEWG